MHSESDGQHFYSRYLWLVVFVPSEDLEYVPWEMRKKPVARSYKTQRKLHFWQEQVLQWFVAGAACQCHQHHINQ